MNIRPQIKETLDDGTPYRVSQIMFEAAGAEDELVLASIADVLSTLVEVHMYPNSVEFRRTPKPVLGPRKRMHQHFEGGNVCMHCGVHMSLWRPAEFCGYL